MIEMKPKNDHVLIVSRLLRHQHSSWLGSETKLGSGSTVEYDELRLEEDVTVDGEANASVGLDATEASWKVC